MANGLTRSFSKDKRTSQSKKIYEVNGIDSDNNHDVRDNNDDDDNDNGSHNVKGKNDDNNETLHKVNDPFDFGAKKVR